jgi:hypothetical protein
MNRRRVVALAGDAWLVEPRRVQFTHHAVNARTLPKQRAVRFGRVGPGAWKVMGGPAAGAGALPPGTAIG